MRPESVAFAAAAWQPQALVLESTLGHAAGRVQAIMRLRGFLRQRRDDITQWQDAWDELHDADRGMDDGHGTIIWRDAQGRPHRRSGPSVIDAGRRLEFHRHGRRHRLHAPAVIDADGTRQYFVDGARHRHDGPAVITADGTQEWWVHGMRHRDIGAAVIRPDGTREYWRHGIPIEGDGYPSPVTDLAGVLFGRDALT